jgi:hypothetical protein
MGVVTDYIKRVYGVDTESKDYVYTLNSTTPIQILKANPNRFAWQCFNLGAGIGYLSPLSIVTTTRGIQLNALGGALAYSAKTDLELPTREFFAIGSAATTLYIIETVAI